MVVKVEKHDSSNHQGIKEIDDVTQADVKGNESQCKSNNSCENAEALRNEADSLGSQSGPLNVDLIKSVDQANSEGNNCEVHMDQSSSNNAKFVHPSRDSGSQVKDNDEGENCRQEVEDITHISHSNPENSRHPFDLNTEPYEGSKDVNKEIVSGLHKESIPDSKGTKQKKSINAKVIPTSMKLKDVMRANYANSQRKSNKTNRSQGSQNSLSKSENSISVELMKTKNIGDEVGFCLEGFEEMLRAEIEGEGVFNQQK
ncbi:hypothetical protein L2E82_37947 [Cichorium intybus]|uniref:Uncharacterized protein n=2 Tax=Cichorium intybus TaxID=13427 RepID=A0ACB9AF85_CICIN|nr:hypothetical protein L2E82_37942 [Cichorium intybus]KAI3708640.1 hypothetical protein L2E82_37947 [Cichorium intybus]